MKKNTFFNYFYSKQQQKCIMGLLDKLESMFGLWVLGSPSPPAGTHHTQTFGIRAEIFDASKY